MKIKATVRCYCCGQFTKPEYITTPYKTNDCVSSEPNEPVFICKKCKERYE